MTELWSSDELATHEFPEPAYLVDPMIPQGGLVVLHGKPNVGKTQLVLTLASAINSGEPFLGRWPTRQGPVIVVQADMTGQIQQQRVARVIRSVNIGSTYWVVEEDGSTPLIDITTMSVLKRDLVEMMREIDPVLTVWDTLRKIHRLPENKSESPITVYSKALSILPHSTHLFNHHERKVSRDPDAVDTEDEDFMGNQQWKGAADATLRMEEIGTPPKRLKLQFLKARTAPDTEKVPIHLELDLDSILLRPLKVPGGSGQPAAPEALRLDAAGRRP